MKTAKTWIQIQQPSRAVPVYLSVDNSVYFGILNGKDQEDLAKYGTHLMRRHAIQHCFVDIVVCEGTSEQDFKTYKTENGTANYWGLWVRKDGMAQEEADSLRDELISNEEIRLQLVYSGLLKWPNPHLAHK